MTDLNKTISCNNDARTTAIVRTIADGYRRCDSGLMHDIENKAVERSMFVLRQQPGDCRIQGLKRSK